MPCRVGVAWGDELLRYSFPEPHPFRRERVIAFYAELSQLEKELAESVVRVKPEQAARDDLILFHEADYIDFVRRRSEEGRGYLDYGDTPAFRGCYEASLYVVGSTLKLIKLILQEELDHGFNPVGGLHHARRSSAGGFCIFNDVAVAIKYLLERERLSEILYVDIDAHHGNGTQDIFMGRENVIYISLHQVPLYPGTGLHSQNNCYNFPLPPGTQNEEYLHTLDEALQIISEFNPDVIALSLGLDTYCEDLLTNFQLTFEAYEKIGEKLKKFRPLFAVLEGGYTLQLGCLIEAIFKN